MITFWIAALRSIGVALFIFSVAGIMRIISFLPLYRFSDAWYGDVRSVLETFALTVLCFAASSGLNAIHRMEARQIQAARRRASSNAPVQPQTRSVAPDAPNWPEMKLGIHPDMQVKRLKRSQRKGTDDPGALYENVVAHGIRIYPRKKQLK